MIPSKRARLPPRNKGTKNQKAVNTKKAETKKGEVGWKTTTGPTRRTEGPSKETKRVQ